MVEEKVLHSITNYGKIVINIKDIMKENDISIYALSKKTGIKYDLLKKYYHNEIYRIDLANVAKICYALKCDSKDIIKYISSEN
ncbi:MAG: helix-turn-helix transcriptional regulator [Bacilli bacterium]